MIETNTAESLPHGTFVSRMAHVVINGGKGEKGEISTGAERFWGLPYRKMIHLLASLKSRASCCFQSPSINFHRHLQSQFEYPMIKLTNWLMNRVCCAAITPYSYRRKLVRGNCSDSGSDVSGDWLRSGGGSLNRRLNWFIISQLLISWCALASRLRSEWTSLFAFCLTEKS